MKLLISFVFRASEGRAIWGERCELSWVAEKASEVVKWRAFNCVGGLRGIKF